MEFRLDELFDLQMGKTPSRNDTELWKTKDYKWITISDLSKSKKYISQTDEYLSNKAIDELGIKVIPSNTVIMSFKLSIGKTAITSEPMYSNEAIMAFLDKHTIDLIPDYIYYLLSSKDWNDGANKAVLGKTLNKATLLSYKIKIHSSSKQKQIIQTLDKLQHIISLREKQLAKLDEIVKARFVEMFGDPIVNDKKWDVKKLPELGEFGRGVSKHRPRNAPELLGGKYPLVQTGDVANANLYITDYDSTYSEMGFRQSKMWKAGTLCITIAATIAKTAILKFDSCFPDSVVGFTPNNQTNSLFINYWFSFFQKIIEDQAPMVAQKNINLDILSKLRIITPPISLQNDFAEFVEKVNKVKENVKQSLDKLKVLFSSLMQDYFS